MAPCLDAFRTRPFYELRQPAELVLRGRASKTQVVSLKTISSSKSYVKREAVVRRHRSALTIDTMALAGPGKEIDMGFIASRAIVEVRPLVIMEHYNCGILLGRK